MRMRKGVLSASIFLVSATISCGCVSFAVAADYPASAVRLVIPFPPGGSTDLVGRLLAAHFGAAWKQTVIVENKPGGNGMLAPTYVSKAQPDGYTLLLASPSVATAPATMKIVPIDAQKDLSPISQLVESPNVVFVNSKMPVKTLQELIDYAKANPGKLNSGTYAMGSRLTSGRFNVIANVNMPNVGYRGEALMIAAVAAGEAEVGIATPVTMAEFIARGQIRLLAVSSAKRLSAFPDVPTAAEAGLPAFDLSAWFGLFAPPQTPLAIRSFIAKEVAVFAQQKHVIDTLATAGFSPKASSPDELASFLASETKIAIETAKAIGLEKQ